MDDLREKAEHILANRDKLDDYSSYDLSKFIEELNTYQIELELQNEELLNTNVLLDSSKKQYMDLYENAPIPYFTLDRNKLIVELNYAAAKLLNSSRISLINIPFDDFLSSADNDIFCHLFEQSFEAKENLVTELKITINNKQVYVQLTLSPYYDRFHHAKMMRLVAMDITEVKLQNIALRVSDEMYRTVFDNCSDAIITTQNGIINSCNLSAIDLFAYPSKGELLNKNIELLLPEFHNTELKSNIEFEKHVNVSRNNKSTKFITNFMKLNCDIFKAEVVMFSLNNNEQNMIHCTIKAL